MWRVLAESLPGRLLLFTVAFGLLAQLLVLPPMAAAFRSQWLWDRINAAQLAAMAADVAPGGALDEAAMRELLSGSGAVAVARITGGRNELVLYGAPVDGTLIVADLRAEGWLGGAAAALDTLAAPEGRYLRVLAEPPARPGEVIDAIIPEAPLRQALLRYMLGLLQLTGFVALVTGALLYLMLFFLFVRPMRRLSAAMTRFQAAPADPGARLEPSRRADEIGQAERALAAMQGEIRQALAQRERLAALGSAVARINHDLRNVLASAQLVSDRLAASDDAQVRRMGERLVRAVGRGVRLCEETLRYGRAGEAEPAKAALPLRAALEEAMADARAAEGAAGWRNDVSAEIVLYADPDQTHRIFLNLMRNALQAMAGLPEGSRRLSATARVEDGSALVEIADVGPGVAEKALQTLFEPFAASTRKDGSGLGLSTARDLARAQGGDVMLARTGPEGSVFAVRLPVAETQADQG